MTRDVDTQALAQFDDIAPIAAASKANGAMVDISGTIRSVPKPTHPEVTQTGVIQDSTAAIQFMVLAEAALPRLPSGESLAIRGGFLTQEGQLPTVLIHENTAIYTVDDGRWIR